MLGGFLLDCENESMDFVWMLSNNMVNTLNNNFNANNFFTTYIYDSFKNIGYYLYIIYFKVKRDLPVPKLVDNNKVDFHFIFLFFP